MQYTKASTDQIIKQTYPTYKYYGTYPRKYSREILIQRYYQTINGSTHTLSVLPSFLLVRKRKPLELFLQVVLAFSKGKSLAKIWEFSSDEHFACLKTLYRHLSLFTRQIDSILISLSSQVYELKGNSIFKGLLPNQDNTLLKLSILFNLIEELTTLLHRNGSCAPFIGDEKFFYLNSCLFTHAHIVLLDST